MFLNLQNNINMIQGAYRKLKSYYYYNKNFLIMRKKIAEFEGNSTSMDETFKTLAYILAHPKTNKAKNLIFSLVNGVDFYVIPKKFETEPITNNSLISNAIPHNKKMKSVNFFIDAPIELHILDTLWTVFLGKMEKDKKTPVESRNRNFLTLKNGKFYNSQFSKFMLCEWDRSSASLQER